MMSKEIMKHMLSMYIIVDVLVYLCYTCIISWFVVVHFNWSAVSGCCESRLSSSRVQNICSCTFFWFYCACFYRANKVKL